jgi:hypothetical protein
MDLEMMNYNRRRQVCMFNAWSCCRKYCEDVKTHKFWLCRNRTPDKLTASERLAVTSACNAALCSIIDVLQPRLIVGVGQ